MQAVLLTPTVTLCHGGKLDEMRALPSYERLRNACADHSVDVFESVMSTNGMVNVARGAWWWALRPGKGLRARPRNARLTAGR